MTENEEEWQKMTQTTENDWMLLKMNNKLLKITDNDQKTEKLLQVTENVF